jgi:hypothetical protein
MTGAKTGFDCRKRAGEQAIEIGSLLDLLRAIAQCGQQTWPGRRRQCGFGNHGDVVNMIDVCALQPEHAAHAGMGRDTGQFRFHVFEHRALVFGAQIAGM